ncbi:5087_t:CDS:2, partial [Gigaspora rosea]
SAYNPVERSMATFSGKLADITLPIDKYGTHLSSQGKVQDIELGLRNFRYVGERLCELWRKDLVFGKPVFIEYTNQSRCSALADPLQHLVLSNSATMNDFSVLPSFRETQLLEPFVLIEQVSFISDSVLIEQDFSISDSE